MRSGLLPWTRPHRHVFKKTRLRDDADYLAKYGLNRDYRWYWWENRCDCGRGLGDFWRASHNGADKPE